MAAANHHRQVQGIYNNLNEQQDPQAACTEEPETIESAGDPVMVQGTYISEAIQDG